MSQSDELESKATEVAKTLDSIKRMWVTMHSYAKMGFFPESLFSAGHAAYDTLRRQVQDETWWNTYLDDIDEQRIVRGAFKDITVTIHATIMLVPPEYSPFAVPMSELIKDHNAFANYMHAREQTVEKEALKVFSDLTLNDRTID